MKISIASFVSLLLLGNGLNAQSKWEIILGPSYTNIRHIQNDQQIIYNHTLNAPLWNIGFQVGVNKLFRLTNKTYLNSGIELQLKGDRKSRHEIFPNDEYYGARFLYIAIPLHFKLKLLNSYNIFLAGGIRSELLIHQNVTSSGFSYFPIQGFGNRFELSSQIGYNYQLNKHFSIEIMYSQGLTNIYVTKFIGDDVNDIIYKHQGFEFSFNYKL